MAPEQFVSYCLRDHNLSKQSQENVRFTNREESGSLRGQRLNGTQILCQFLGAKVDGNSPLAEFAEEFGLRQAGDLCRLTERSLV